MKDKILGQKEVEDIEEQEKQDKPITFQELSEMVVKEPEYLIEKILVKGSITLLGAPRSSYKSVLSMYLAICLSEGIAFLGKYPTKKCNVLYISGEDGKDLFHYRLVMCKNGMNINLENHNSIFLYTNLKLNKEEDLKEFERILRENKIEVVIFDTMKRFHTLKENNVEGISLLFTDILKPLLKKFDLTLFLIHHTRKKPIGQNIFDKMDTLRGSSDIANNSECILMPERQGIEKFILLFNERTKFGEENEPIGIKFDFDKENMEMKVNFVPEEEWSISQAPYYEKLTLEWIRKEDLVKFKTKELKQHFKNNNINFQDATINRVLESLELKHKIRKIKRGEWEVVREIQNDLKGVV